MKKQTLRLWYETYVQKNNKSYKNEWIIPRAVSKPLLEDNRFPRRLSLYRVRIILREHPDWIVGRLRWGFVRNKREKEKRNRNLKALPPNGAEGIYNASHAVQFADQVSLSIYRRRRAHFVADDDCLLFPAKIEGGDCLFGDFKVRLLPTTHFLVIRFN